MNYYLDVFKKYAVFTGRASLNEYWTFSVMNFIIAVLLILIEIFVFDGKTTILVSIFSLVIFLPSIAVTVRRLHDTNKSGWMMLVGFIPFIGPIWLLILMLIKGTQGDNMYGPNPKIKSMA